MKDRNHGILTTTRCPALEKFEAEGNVVMQKHACEDICVPGMQLTGECINPRMKCQSLKLPPRESKDEVACVWEFKIE